MPATAHTPAPITARLALIAAVVTVLIWTSFIVIARASAMRSLTPFDISVLRFIGAGSVLLPWALWQIHVKGAPRGWLGISLLPTRLTVYAGLLAGVAYSFLAYSGFFFAPAAHASVLMPGMLPLWTALLSIAVFGERVSPARWAALGLLLLGAALVGGASIWQGIAQGQGVWIGDVLFLCTSFTWASFGLLIRRYQPDPIAITAAVSAFCLVTVVPVFAILVASGVMPTGLNRAPWWEICFQMFVQGGLSVVVSGITFAIMIRHYGPVKTTMVTALVPGLSALGAVAFLGEPLGLNLLLGLACVTLGIVLGVRAQASAAPAAPLAKAVP